MNTLNSDLPQALLLGTDVQTRTTDPAATNKATVARKASALRLPYGMAPVDRKTAAFEHACFWLFMLAGAYALVRAFVI